MDDVVIARNPEPVAGSQVEQWLAVLAPAQVPAWAHEQGLAVSAKGRVPAPVRLADERAHGG